MQSPYLDPDAPQPPYPPYPAPPGYGPAPRQNNTLGILALIFGAVSLLTFCCGLLGIGFGAIAVVLGVIGVRRATGGGPARGLSLAGLICGVVGLMVALGLMVFKASVSFLPGL